jgi:7-cyano-7-deazaguanine synthase
MNRVVMLFSGGYDSTLSTILMAERGNVELHGLTINYSGRPRGEVRAARQLAKRLPFRSYNLMQLELPISLYGKDSNGVRTTAPSGAIPYRNLMFWSLAAFFAARIRAGSIAAGHTRSDADDYSDASNTFFQLFGRISAFNGVNASSNPVKIVLPLRSTDPKEYAKLASKAEALLSLTWSCWHDNAKPCGECYSCKQRARYLESLRVM